MNNQKVITNAPFPYDNGIITNEALKDSKVIKLTGNGMTEEFTGIVSEYYKDLCQYRELILEYAMRFLINPPLRGKLTLGKINERHLRIEYYDYNILFEKEDLGSRCIMLLYQGENPVNLNLQGEEKEHFYEWAKRKHKVDLRDIF